MAQVTDILRECHQQKVPVFVASDVLDITFQTLIKTVSDDAVVIENPIKPEYISKFSKAHKYFLQSKMLRLQADHVVPSGQFIRFPIMENSVIEETRQAERFMFSPDEKVICEILNPYDQKTRISKLVMDMSATGLSLRTNLASNLFRPNLAFTEIKVFIDGKIYMQGKGRVVYHRRFMDLVGRLRVQVGIKFENHTLMAR